MALVTADLFAVCLGQRDIEHQDEHGVSWNEGARPLGQTRERIRQSRPIDNTPSGADKAQDLHLRQTQVLHRSM